MMRSQTKPFKLPALAIAAAAILVCSTALGATTTPQPVKVIEFSQQAGYNQLLIQLKDGVNYYANPGMGPPGCGIIAPNLETAKIWLSLAQASMLSGKNVMIYYTTCNSWNFITGIDLGP